MSGFPSIMPMSLPIRIGQEYKSPYQWAADLAPDDQLIKYKNAMLWLEGEDFDTKEQFLYKVEKIVKYQEADTHVPEATSAPPVQEKDEEEEGGKEDTTVTTSKEPVSDGFTAAAPKKTRKPKTAAVTWTKRQVAKAIVDGCIKELDRTFKFTGPSLRISDVYERFDKKAYTFPAIIGCVRDEIANLSQPSTRYAVPKSARYNAAGSPGKGKNFNFKVQCKDSSKPNGWSAVAQIHVIWE